VALQTGDIAQALSSIKAGIRALTHDWNKLEGVIKANADASESSILSKSSNSSSDTSNAVSFMGPRFWALAPSFLRSLLQISTVYAHIGMYQETVYYAEYAGRIAEGTRSTLYRAQVATWIGTIYSKACKLDKAADLLVQAKDYIPDDVCAARVRLASELAGFYRDIGENEESAEYFRIAEETAQKLNEMQKAEMPPAGEQQVKKAAVKATPAARTTRGTRAAARTTTTTTTRATRRTAAPKPKPATSVQIPEAPQDLYRSSLTASVALSRALTFIQQRDWEAALASLAAVRDMPKLLGTLSQEQIVTATSLIGQSMELMIKDPVFSVMQDSTISFPATSAASAKAAMERMSPGKSPPAKGKAVAGAKKGAKESLGVPLFANALVKAQELLLEAHSTGLTSSDSAMVHRISALLQSTVIMLSATSATRAMTGSSPAFATVAAELARNVVWKRELMTLKATSIPLPHKKAIAPRRSSLGLVSDMTRLQTNYIEMVPKNWSVISMSLSDNHHDLYITKFQAGHSPFVLRLPLERANSRDADAGIFNFAHGQEELLDIIKHANETCHSAKDFNVKGERTAWWEEREALDERLKELLETIEGTWLGGFKGIFSQHHRRPDLLARFQKSFQKILDGCLPSRNNRMAHGKKPAKPQGVTLDPRILDLFIGLGDPSEPTNDFDEALNDLLYFVVDILQFHGERNAYDEIDFDAMVVETYDALRGYYAALNRGFGREDGAHTILVLDKALHAFPWESMPCMDGLAISRVPSLSCLRRLLTEANKPTNEDRAVGHYVSASTGTYVLNPSSDLKNTQRFFQPSFASHLPAWTSHVNQAPNESDFETALSSSEIFLYFGHGSGAQYVRSSRIRALERCRPATFLMGCSSAALSTAGAFECHGPVWNHLVAGCPAVVGTLWDVTDRDIDRFAGRAFEEWGLFERGTFKDEKKQGRAVKTGGMSIGVSLTEAVARAKEVCRFRYLNAAAVVQYGIPVYISREDEQGS
jgi:separase